VRGRSPFTVCHQDIAVRPQIDITEQAGSDFSFGCHIAPEAPPSGLSPGRLGGYRPSFATLTYAHLITSRRSRAFAHEEPKLDSRIACLLSGVRCPEVTGVPRPDPDQSIQCGIRSYMSGPRRLLMRVLLPGVVESRLDKLIY
jgi:hypothetical protein